MGLKIRTGEFGDLAALLKLYQHMHTTDAALSPVSRLQQVWHEIVDDPKIHRFFSRLVLPIPALRRYYGHCAQNRSQHSGRCLLH